jgi:hypothetical protein
MDGHVDISYAQGVPMITKRPAKSKSKRKSPAANGKSADWRETLRRRLTKVPEIEAIYIVESIGTIHVFTVIAEHRSEIYPPLMKQEDFVEKDHPFIQFEFHTREHQGRPPHRSVPFDAERVFMRK